MKKATGLSCWPTPCLLIYTDSIQSAESHKEKALQCVNECLDVSGAAPEADAAPVPALSFLHFLGPKAVKPDRWQFNPGGQKQMKTFFFLVATALHCVAQQLLLQRRLTRVRIEFIRLLVCTVFFFLEVTEPL